MGKTLSKAKSSWTQENFKSTLRFKSAKKNMPKDSFNKQNKQKSIEFIKNTQQTNQPVPKMRSNSKIAAEKNFIFREKQKEKERILSLVGNES